MGSASLITDENGNEYQRLEYTPYGEVWVDKYSQIQESTALLPYKFTGKERDEETGLYYYGARYLDAKYSRWISTDPALGDYVPQAPINDEAKKHNQNLPGMGGVFNTVNFNLYHYAGNNPIKYTDPDGREDIFSGVSQSEILPVLKTFKYIQDITGQNPLDIISEFNKQHPNNKIDAITLYTLFTDADAAKTLLMEREELHKDLRYQLNKNAPSTEREAINRNMIKLSSIKSLFHNPLKNNKYVSQDGHLEGVYDKQTGESDIDNKVMATFNFFDPNTHPMEHKKTDVDPYGKWGN